jgi:hypothetical protein
LIHTSRIKNIDGNWLAPKLILSQFAGELVLDGARNLYFVQTFCSKNMMIEADIYVV